MIVLLPILGPLTWIILNWIIAAEGRMDPIQSRGRSTPQAPDDDTEFLDDISRRIERQQRRDRKKMPPPKKKAEPEEENGSDEAAAG